MLGGTIAGNTSNFSGGGVYVSQSVTFNKTNGIIYGYTLGNINSNVIKNSLDTVQSNSGHAVFVLYDIISIRKETDAGPDVNLFWNGIVNPPTFNGGWEY